MNLSRCLSVIIIFQFSFIWLNAQPWLFNIPEQKSASATTTKYQTQKIYFDAYWQSKNFRQGKGYKQFRRWEQFLQPRIYNQDSINSSAYWNALLSILDTSTLTDTLNWKLVGPDNTPSYINSSLLAGSGRLNCIAFHPTNSNMLYVGAPSGGLWISEDKGESWNTTTDQLNSIGISDIVVIEGDTSTTIYLATGDGDAGDTYAIGIIKSTDGGLNWQPTGLSLNASNTNYFRRMVSLSPKGKTMLATSNKGVYRTNDSWETFSLVVTGDFKDLEVHPNDTNIVYATSFNSNGNAKIFVSTDGGQTFNESMSGLNISGKVNRIELAVTPNYENLVYALCSSAENSGFYALYRSLNKGLSWNLLYDDTRINLLGRYPNGNDLGGQGHYDIALAASPDNYKDILVGGINMWRSDNGGTQWEISSYLYHSESFEYVHADHHMIVYSPHSNEVYSANDGGIYLSENKGVSWSDITNNLEILQVYKFGSSETTEDYLISGNQDNGTLLHNQNNWNLILGGDGMYCHVNRESDSMLFASAYNGLLFKSEKAGEDFKDITPEENLFGAWITPFLMDPIHNSTLYAAYNDVYKSIDNGETWSKISENLSAELLQNLAIASSNSDFIYAATFDKLFKTDNGGVNWQEVRTGFTDLAITSLAISPNDPNKIWVSLSGYNELDKIYYSSNGGSSWINYSTGLPNVPVNKVIMRYNSNNELFAATDVGVYYRNADSSSWSNISSRLPNVIVSDLEIIEPFSILRAGTYGRGIWQASLPPVIPSKANFGSNLSAGCIDAPFTLFYLDTVSYDSLKWSIGDGEITYSSVQNDTIQVKFLIPGKKTIQLTQYKDSSSITEIKYNFLNIKDTLEIILDPSEYFACDTSSILIELKSGYNYSWSPSDYLDTVAGNRVTVTPESSIVYTIGVQHGICQTNFQLPVIYMPNRICDAQYIEKEVEDNFDNSCATSEENEPLPPEGTGDNDGCISQDGWCQGYSGLNNTLWFKFLAGDFERIMARVDGIDSRIALYNARSCDDLKNGNFKLLAANDDRSLFYSGSLVDIDSGFVPSDTLWLQIDVSDNSFPGTLSLLVSTDTSRIYTSLPHTDINSLKIYPNPATNNTTLELKQPDGNELIVELFDYSGRLAYYNEYRITPGINTFTTTIQTADLKGVYIIRIRSDKKVYTSKLIVY